MRESFREKEHLFRVAGLFLLGLLVFLVARAIFVPAGFGKYGHYRPGAVPDIRAQVPVFAGRQTCADCHTDVPPAMKPGKHAKIGCEACHGPLAGHAEEPDKFKPAKLDPRALCLTCHTQNLAKPKKFPQIDPAEHGEGAACTSCHAAHDPTGTGSGNGTAAAATTPTSGGAAK
jgi:hypothetical protein